ncbi:ClpX C4-type zinc finger protein [Priestia endophytica]|uniref:ClpX C4-type zinc finger protein n=1 Tax=Priestia endophytica TaxID=135735 RepID=UPI002281AAC8|nr:ClpX C4-type zinc finger protein [Priestia endophytica]MCY8232559.1 ClpX C4-type zinc finger protein [Priestia endophytica]
MDQDFRKKTFRGAKIEDMILELENLSAICEEKSQKSEEMERQRFYEGMAVAYTTLTVKLKGEFDYIEPVVIDELYKAMEKTSQQREQNKTDVSETCSFCRRSKEEVGELAMGPGVSICKNCLEFGVEVLNAPTPNS